jgi:hypothetical protein
VVEFKLTTETGIEESGCNINWEIKNKESVFYYAPLTEKVIIENKEIKLIYSIRIYELAFDDYEK